MHSHTTTQEIPKSRWRTYFDDASELYQGWAVAIEVLGSELGDQYAGKGPPLQGLSFETAGSEAGDILIEVGDSIDEFLIHHVDRPRAVRAALLRPGEELDLQFESDDGVITLVCLRRRQALPPGPQRGTSIFRPSTRKGHDA